MNKMLLGLMVSASVAATAQTSSTSATTTAAPAAQTSSTTATEAAPAAAKKWGGGAYISAFTTEGAMKTGGAVESLNYLEVNYQASANIKLAVRHNYAFIFANKADGKDAYAMEDTELQLKTKYGPLLGSSPVAVGFRYYLPTSERSRLTNRLGTLRVDISNEWTVTPKIAIGAYVSPRWTINTAQNSNKTVGSDDQLRVVAGPSATYSFNDNINTYYSPTLDWASVGYVRGDMKAVEGRNYISHEIGANFQLGKMISLNPAFISYQNLAGGEALGENPDANEYDLNLLATF